ncbi:unannotated protein [freshwater metagenome]|uniref:Unannotated protein n=1 Tax=freshwater metagenome TaxID=449393 RepID=A0A6J7C8Y9_9ZZZZ
MAEEQSLAGGQVRLNRELVELTLLVIGGKDHDDVGLGTGHLGSDDAQTLGLGLGARGTSLEKADADVDARVAQVQAVRVSLAAVTDHSNLASRDDRKIGVFVVEKFGHGGSLLARWMLGEV